MENSKNNKKSIQSYRDLDVYQKLYKAMLIVMKEIVPKLPKEEKYDLTDQMRRACKAPPALLAEGFAKRYQKRNWKKYIDDSIGECNEMTNHLTVAIDLYSHYVDVQDCKEAINLYDISSRQLYNLQKSWKNFHEEK